MKQFLLIQKKRFYRTKTSIFFDSYDVILHFELFNIKVLKQYQTRFPIRIKVCMLIIGILTDVLIMKVIEICDFRFKRVIKLTLLESSIA